MMELEKAHLSLIREKDLERTKQRIYVPLLSAYTTLSKFFNTSKQSLMGAGLMVETGTGKLEELDELLIRAGKLYKEILLSSYAIVADDLFAILNTSSTSEAKPFQTSPAWIVYPKNYQPSRVLSEGFATNYRLANALLHSSLAKELGLDEVGKKVKSELDKILEDEIRRKRAWITAIEEAL